MPQVWMTIKIIFLINNFIVSIFFINKIEDKIINNKTKKLKNNTITLNKKNIKESEKSKNNLKILIGTDIKNNKIFIPEKGLYQNILVTGTIGTGKTSSAMYPITEQLIKYNFDNNNLKIGMLVLDVKGNYYMQISIIEMMI